MLETFRGTRALRYLWYEQRGLCTQCHTKITRTTGWRLHYCVPGVKGGSTGALKRRSKGMNSVKGTLHAQF